MPEEDWKVELTRHIEDDLAHPRMIRAFMVGEVDPWRLEDARWKQDAGKRFTYLERAWWMMLGGMIVISTLLAAGGLTIAVHLLTTQP